MSLTETYNSLPESYQKHEDVILWKKNSKDFFDINKEFEQKLERSMNIFSNWVFVFAGVGAIYFVYKVLFDPSTLSGKVGADIIVVGANVLWVFVAFFCIILLSIPFSSIVEIIKKQSFEYKINRITSSKTGMEKIRVFSKRERIRQETLLDRAKKKRKQIKYWKSLSGDQFEFNVARVLREIGYTDVSVSNKGIDGGVDITMHKDNQLYLVQCKAHKNPVGIADIQRHYGVCVSQNAKPIFASTNGYTEQSKKFADQINMTLYSTDFFVKESVKQDV